MFITYICPFTKKMLDVIMILFTKKSEKCFKNKFKLICYFTIINKVWNNFESEQYNTTCSMDTDNSIWVSKSSMGCQAGLRKAHSLGISGDKYGID